MEDGTKGERDRERGRGLERQILQIEKFLLFHFLSIGPIVALRLVNLSLLSSARIHYVPVSLNVFISPGRIIFEFLS